MATKTEKTIPVSREKTVVVYRKPSERMQRELNDEIMGFQAQGYRVTCMKRVHNGVEIHFVKEDDWSLDELMSEVHELLDR